MQHDQLIKFNQLFGYIGEERGIEGHQNSSYLDSTVFGLFAVSDIFDSMFLQQQHDDPDGDEVKYLLWKGIVNPLRKYALHNIHAYEYLCTAESAILTWEKLMQHLCYTGISKHALIINTCNFILRGLHYIV